MLVGCHKSRLVLTLVMVWGGGLVRLDTPNVSGAFFIFYKKTKQVLNEDV